MEEDIKAHLREYGVAYTETEDMESVLPSLDGLYVTRIQDEYDQGGESSKVDLSRFKLGMEHLPRMRKDAVIMHPLPRRDEIHPDVDEDPRAKYWRQERNGMWMRAAILTKIFGVDGQIPRASGVDSMDD